MVFISTLVVGPPGADAGAVPAVTQNLSVALGGTGSGSVSSSPAGIDCPPTCTFDFNFGDSVSLTPNPDAGSTFDHWTGDCVGSGSCDLTMDVDHNVAAIFTLTTHTLTVDTSGGGSGTVSSTPGGINNCASSCSHDYDFGTDVSLAPNPDPGSGFDHWTGDCTGSGSCDVVMNSDQAVTAVFTLNTHTLSVDTSGTGSGTVSSSPGGINNCASSCSHDYAQGTAVSLPRTPIRVRRSGIGPVTAAALGRAT